MTSVNPVQDRAEDLLQAAITAMTATPAGAPAVSLVAPGDHAWDTCCKGTAYVRIVRLFAYTTFPTPIVADQALRCPTGRAVELEVVTLRCAPTAPGGPTTGGRIESARASVDLSDVEQSAIQLHADAYQLVKAVQALACTWSDTDDLACSITPWVPAGPEGGCVGGMMTVVVELP